MRLASLQPAATLAEANRPATSETNGFSTSQKNGADACCRARDQFVEVLDTDCIAVKGLKGAEHALLEIEIFASESRPCSGCALPPGGT